MESFDVAVVGLGAMGSAALYQLSKTGLKVVGIDRFTPPHSKGSSHGQSRITRQALGEGTYYSPLVLRANEIWRELEHLTGQKLFDPCGFLMICNQGNDFFETTKQASIEYGIDHQLLDARAVAEKFPAVDLAQDESAYYEPGGGYLRPEKCIEVQLQLARDNGAVLRFGVEVTSIQEDAKGVTVSFDNGESIRADKVICAQGPWVTGFIPLSIKSLFKTLYQTLYWFDYRDSAAAHLMPGTMPVIMCKTRRLRGPEHYNFYGFPILPGKPHGIKFAIHDIPPEIDPDQKDEVPPVAGVAELLYENVSKFVSGIEPAVVQQTNCVYTVTPDENFVIDYSPGSDRIIIASPCSGHGFKHSAAIGEVLAQMVTRGTSTIDISEFSLARFTSKG